MTNPDLKIAQSVTPKRIDDVASALGLPLDEIERYGNHKAKLPTSLIDESKIDNCNLVLVTAITPTPAGEGKSTVTVGLSDGLNKIGKKTIGVLREPSLGPVFGIKGGATGGGYSQVIPMEDINLHFTGDFAAIEKANNLLSALIGNNIQSRTRNLGIDPRTVTWKWVMDMNDRTLRHIVSGLGGKTGGFPRESGFDITAASEVMAILCLSKDLADLKERLNNIYIGESFDGKAIYARDLNAAGSMATLLKDAIKPNLVQTLEGNPAILHGGPFANIAQGTNSLIATKMGMSLADFVVTEAGFGADLGAEKFFNIKCYYGGISPKAVVLVATARALKYHGGAPKDKLTEPNVAAVVKGLANLDKHVENLKRFGIPAVVAVNRFVSDTPEELAAITDHVKSLGLRVSVSEGWAKGGEGTSELAELVVEATQECKGKYQPTYSNDMSVQDKISAIARDIYGASQIDYTQKSKDILKRVDKLNVGHLPICMAKTQSSLTDDGKVIGRPNGFTITVRDMEIATGAGFLIPITGKVMKHLLNLTLLLCSVIALAQPQTEVYLFDLKVDGKNISISNPQNISDNDGYDNQPSFTSDGLAVLFASTRNGQTDVLGYNVKDGSKQWLTDTPGSEYSPIQTPAGGVFTAILLEEDGRQLLWQYPLNGGDGKIAVNELVIGYHCWYDENNLYAFVLGNHEEAPDASNTFQLINTLDAEASLVDTNIGRSIHRIPDSKSVSYVKKHEDRWALMSLKGNSKKELTSMPEGVEDMVWLADGSVVAGKDAQLLRWHPKWSPDWEVIADLDDYEKAGITRLAVSPDQTRIAIVINE
ncbi:fhs [Symbiodinium microadriaticum]|nr:fhs [Symbiodinium microadriaticum]